MRGILIVWIVRGGILGWIWVVAVMEMGIVVERGCGG
jgi:hypothetical protein